MIECHCPVRKHTSVQLHRDNRDAGVLQVVGVLAFKTASRVSCFSYYLLVLPRGTNLSYSASSFNGVRARMTLGRRYYSREGLRVLG